MNHLKMKQIFAVASRKCLWVVLITLVCTFTGNRVEASTYTAIDNQMKIEVRPYTKTAMDPSTTGPTHFSSINKVLQPKFREMHRNCDGQCFYAPSACAISNAYQDCHIAASIGGHNEDPAGELYCDYFGNDSLRQSFCSSSNDQIKYRTNTSKGQYDRFYTVTLHRTLENKDISCKSKWNEETGRRCRRTEFVGISFGKNATATATANASLLGLDDLWYVCTVDETRVSRITMWTDIDLSKPNVGGKQIVGTSPHLGSGAGVVFSKVLMNEDTSSMGCQFVLQESNMTVRFPPKNAAFFNDRNSSITVKLAAGIVKRSSVDDSILYPFYDSGKLPPYVMYSENEIKPINKIFFDALEVKTKNPIQDLGAELAAEKDHLASISKVLEKCDKPKKFSNLLIGCYPPNFQLNCVHTGRCPVMFIVEIPKSDKSFDTITCHLYSLIPDFRSLRKVLRPTGYASVGFSLDAKMGRDVVISCHAYGRSNISVVVSINIENTNVYPGKVDYNNLIHNVETYGTGNVSRVMCSWQMNTSFLVNMFDYEPEYRSVIQPGQTEKLEFDFKTEEVFLLIAAGNRNYPGGKIVNHDFRQVLKEKFGRELFLGKAKGCRLSPNLTMLFLSTFTVLIFFYL